MREILERSEFVFVGLDERVRHGAKERDIPVHAGQDIRGAVETGQKAGTCREQSGICAVGATQSEIDEQAVGGDLRALAAAVTQLAVDAESGEIDKALIHRYFAGRAEASSFKVADAVLAGNGAVAMENLRWALETGVAPVLITSALAGSFRGMGRLLDAQSRRMSGGELARALGMPPWKIRNLERTSRNWRSGDVAQAIRIVAEGDAAVKGAATDADYALEKMVLAILKLCSR